MDEKESILSRFAKQYAEDKLNEDFELPHGVNKAEFTEDQIKAYEKELTELRKDDLADKLAYGPQPTEILHVTEQDLASQNLIVSKAVKEVLIYRAYCPKCQQEIKCTMPVAFNPFTNEKIAMYECPNCKTRYNLEYAYPRVVFVDEEDNEIEAFGR